VGNIIAPVLELMETQLGSRNRKKVANNTYLVRRENGDIVLILHESPILTATNGSLVLDSCGWQTLTTKERINRYLPTGWTLYSENRIWYLEDPQKARYAFADGITIEPDGSVKNAADLEEANQKIQTVKRYIDAYLKLHPTPPDFSVCPCFRCRPALEPDEHIWQHIDNEEFPDNLLTVAVIACNAEKRAYLLRLYNPAALEELYRQSFVKWIYRAAAIS